MNHRHGLLVALLALPNLLGCGSASRNLTDSTATKRATFSAAELNAPLPLMPAIKHGTLPNGLSYSILKHGKPEKRVFLWLTVDVGSAQEDDDQRGLAHFDEHMAFDGTTHFAKTAIVDYIEKIGMKFGPDLNAHTDREHTVYELEVPTDDAAYIGAGLDILRDWAGAATFDPAELERERGVVLEEWRLHQGANERLDLKREQVLLKGSRYADRRTLGLPEVIQHAPREALLRFYKDYYRPDLMTVIVVGDIEPAAIETEIGKRFSNLENPVHERPRAVAGLPIADGTRISIDADHELPDTFVSIYNLFAHRPDASIADLRRSLIERLYLSMLRERLDEVRRRPDSPLRSAGAGISSIAREIDAFTRGGEVKGGRVEDALHTVLTEVLRANERGFSDGEFSRAKHSLQHAFDESAAREPTASSRELMNELVRNATNGEFVIGARAEDLLAAKLLPGIRLYDVNPATAAMQGDESRVVLISGPDAAQLPSEARVRALLAEVKAEKREAWSEATNQAPLLRTEPKPGSITSEKKIDAIGATEWTLSNGVRVVIKPTDFDANAVQIEGSAPGGGSLFSDADFQTARFAGAAVMSTGVGELDPVALGKKTSAKSAWAGVWLDEQKRGVVATGSRLDIKTLFQLLYLRMTAPRDSQADYEIWKSNYLQSLNDEQRVPEKQFQFKYAEALYGDIPRRRDAIPQDLSVLSFPRALEVYRQLYGDASGYTFIIVGAVDLKQLRPLVETYLASLPSSGHQDSERDLGIRKASGVVEKTWLLGDAPKASVTLDFHSDESWSREKEYDASVLSRVLGIRLREVLRNDLGGVYGVSAGGSITRSPHQERNFAIHFGCEPGQVDKLLQATRAVLLQVASHGASDEVLAKVKQTFLRERETSLKENVYWMNRLLTVYRYGDDPAIILDTDSMLARMTSANVAAAAKLYLDEGQLFQTIMLPAAAPAATPAPAK